MEIWEESPYSKKDLLAMVKQRVYKPETKTELQNTTLFTLHLINTD